MHVDGYVALAGLIVGFTVGLTGMGGGALMTPILILLFNVQPLAAVSSDLVASLVMKPVGAAIHVRHRTVRWRLVALLSIGSVPGAFAGVVFLRLLPRGASVDRIVQYALGAVLILAVAAVAVRSLIDWRRMHRASVAPEATLRLRPLLTTSIGAVVGFMVGITSVGSGSLIIVALLLLYPTLRGSHTVGTDLTQAIPLVASAAIAHLLFGDFKLALTLSILAGSIPGVLLGASISARTGSRVIRVALSVVLMISGLKLVQVDTMQIGIVLIAALVLVPAVWLGIRMSERLRVGSQRVAH